ncbi:lipase maturation factor 2a isoform X2 [Denticeps clupeoides]|uniref:lipase maturation factor 2a isoform X2 n=1 Tax=Denticeps clupeoides TaxID=299321 RepID=UPI0010A42D3B|nr:lipase maturation factor 2 isoform X2 [Denticeps clupeoides]
MVDLAGLYGNEGLLPARWMLRPSGKGLWEQLRDTPTLLWLGPRLGLDTQQGMELLALAGTAVSLLAALSPVLRGCGVYLILWVTYLSLYQVGQVFLYFQWDSLLLEVGFLSVLVAPVNLPLGFWRGRFHDNIMLWLVRWLLFRLMFASGVVKLTSRCPTWWGLTALTYHYETQCIPTPLAWFAHQLPVWWQKLSVVGTFVIEIPVPFLFFSPIRRHRLSAFYLQVFLQGLIILSGNYNFFNLLTITLCFSLLDDEHIDFLLCRHRKNNVKQSAVWTWCSWLGVCVEFGVYVLLLYWTIICFNLHWDGGEVSSKTGFTFHQFNAFLKQVMVPIIWMGVLSLTWEVVTSMFKCACVRGVCLRLWTTLQWGLFSAAAASIFTISLVPFTFVEVHASSSLWPGVRRLYEMTERLHVANSYGLFRRMTGVGGRPEVIVEGSVDGRSWAEIEFMYKPGNVSAAPAFVAPHQPRLDWQLWFAALGPHSQSPWFSSLLQRLLQGKPDVIRLVQTDTSRYPFSSAPPAYLRARRYKYRFTGPQEDGWWRRTYVEEFYPVVQLGDPFLEKMLSQFGLKDKDVKRRGSEAALPWFLRLVRERVCDVPPPLVLSSLFFMLVGVCVLKQLTYTGAKDGENPSKQGTSPAPPPKREKEEPSCATPRKRK